MLKVDPSIVLANYIVDPSAYKATLPARVTYQTIGPTMKYVQYLRVNAFALV